MLASAGVQRSLTEKEKDERFVFFTVTYLLKYFAAICGINQHLGTLADYSFSSM